MSTEATVQMKIGDLNLVLRNRFDAADIAWMREQGSRGDRPFTEHERAALGEIVISLILKCAHDDAPELTREALIGEFPANPADLVELFAAIAVSFQQLRGVIPRESNA